MTKLWRATNIHGCYEGMNKIWRFVKGVKNSFTVKPIRTRLESFESTYRTSQKSLAFYPIMSLKGLVI